MATIASVKRISPTHTFEVKGEKFVVLKKEYLDELSILLKSVATGEKMRANGKTRSFGAFLKARV